MHNGAVYYFVDMVIILRHHWYNTLKVESDQRHGDHFQTLLED